MASSKRNTDGSFQVGVTGETGQSFVLQASSDWAHWENLVTDTMLGALAEVVDADAKNHPRRFYRVVPLELLQERQSPHIQNDATASDSGFRLLIQGNPGEGYIIEASSNLVDWIQADSVILYGPSVEWADSNSLRIPARFYRLRLAP